MENQQSKQEELKDENQDSIAAEREEKHTEHPEKDVISIKDVIDKHPSSSNTHSLPLDEQQYDSEIKSNDEND
ncbi:hypothetical protein A5893_09045 [Pedobacter psychrophilus]|uniref:Uncharacterized protein n=1 Tax=Pedobacter psychrophilus TaxID=1826909 RepID=A0A179DGA4_9SPHI|nr:hypothetical protein [Pedobacter psychrophilus]OAQ39720.1 hypothetical protein A5893_09045 [Pedobacter psychrophilus]